MVIQKRKKEQLDLCLNEQVEFRSKTTWLEEVEFIPHALPQTTLEEIDISIYFLSRRLKAPILIGAMTGGIKQAQPINRTLAAVAEKYGLGFGVGSQRAMYEQPNLASTYQVRDIAPNILLLANIGIFQARAIPPQNIQHLVDSIGADAISIYFNAAMELIQEEGDTDFSNGYETLAHLKQNLRSPLIAKETGTGISREVALKLKAVGIELVDIGGAGGTSWVGVESLRTQGIKKQLGELFWDWGIPTAASLYEVKNLGLTTIASGGIRTGLDIAKAIALGATVVSIALPFLQAYARGGQTALENYINYLIKGLRMAMALTGCSNLVELRQQKLVITGKLKEWILSRNLPLS
jgi:isopentenyl-diphosphate delta-isomerase